MMIVHDMMHDLNDHQSSCRRRNSVELFMIKIKSLWLSHWYVCRHVNELVICAAEVNAA